MLRLQIVRRFIAVLGCFLMAGAQAEDIDLFMNPPIDVGGARPNVLIILDNTANWSRSDDGTTKFAFEKQALTSVLTQLQQEGGNFNVGLMLYSETGSGNPNPSGGYVRFAIQNNLPGLISLVQGLNENGDKGNSAEFALALHEAYLYFKGLDRRGGQKAKTDMSAFVGGAYPTYKSPVTDVCVNNYIIFISNGPPDNGENTTASNLLTGLGGKLASDPIPLNPSTRQAIWADEYARFLSANGVTTYAIDVRPETTGQGPANSALMKSIAAQGKGNYYAVFNAAQLEIALTNVFNEIQAINSVFASSALPVSVNVRGTYLNEVYMGVFRPDDTAGPRWFGNLKVYQFAVDSNTNDLFLADANGQPVQSPVTGFVRPTAVSFWTSASNYWEFSPRGTPPSASDTPDGEVVEKGGAAQRQRTALLAGQGRNLYTCNSGCAAGSQLSDYPFSTGNTALNTALGSDLINWVRGVDNTSPAERAAGSLARPSLHGDVIHSRPAVINYNRNGTDDDIVAFYGANDGVFRAIRGGKNAADGGSELWGLVFPEHFGQLSRLRLNDPKLNVPSNPNDTSLNKPYFADGNVTVYTEDQNSDGRLRADNGDKVYVYSTMRRGGRFMYALDASTPESPGLLWRKGCVGTCDTGYGELGQTWSAAQPGRVRLSVGQDLVSTPMLIMGAGYDQAAEDASPQGSATMGRGVLVINAETGAVLWQVGPSPSGATHNVTRADMTYSVPANVALVDRNRNGYIDRAYAVDTGANVWRIDMTAGDPANWTVFKLATLGGGGSDARKFLYSVEVVAGSDSEGDYDAVLIGSGDREKPFDSDINNAFFMIKDRAVEVGDTPTGNPVTMDDLYDATDNLIQDGTDAEKEVAAEDLDAARGWYVRLRNGEKVVGEAVAVAGTVFFPTHQSGGFEVNPETCVGNLGTARVYSISYKDGSATIDRDGVLGLTVDDRSAEVPGGGLLPSPTFVVVDIDGVPRGGVNLGTTTLTAPLPLDARKRRYWSKSID